MPVRRFSREGQWLLPPSIDELVPGDHPVRFIATFVDKLDDSTWRSWGIVKAGEKDGAPAYHPALLLCTWLYGFMTQVRSSRRLEAACREQLPFIWLTGNQRPDHNTLWRFYKQHRQEMRELVKLTVRTAMGAGLVDLALQAVDGTKIAGNASPAKTLNEAQLVKLMQRVDAAIEDLEAQNATGGDKPAGHLPAELGQAQALRAKVEQALERIRQEGEHRSYINLTDNDVVMLKSHGAYVVGYNAQAMASPLSDEAGGGGFLITAADVVNETDVQQLLPLMQQAEEHPGQRAEMTLADAGYHSGANLAECEGEERPVIMAENQTRALDSAYHKDAFSYDEETDTYTCPEGKTLRFAGTSRRDGKLVRRYLPQSAAICRSCPAFGICTTNKRHGRYLSINPEEGALRRHRAWMETEEAKTLYRQRKQLIEPVFGIIKEQLMGTRRFLLRGLDNIRAEWSLLATGFNLRVLARIWQRRWRAQAAV